LRRPSMHTLQSHAICHPTKLARVWLRGLVLAWLGILASEGAAATLKLAVNPWTGSAVNAHILKILLEEKLDYTVELVAVDEFSQFPALASGELHASLEVWPDGHLADRQHYIEEQKTVEDLGPLGITGKIGWYVPTYLVDDEPALATWEGLKEHATLFRTPATGGRGQFLQGDPTWLYRDQEIIAALGLDLQVVSTGSEEALIAAVESAYTHREPVLFYFWTPHPLQGKHAFTEVQLPLYEAGCAGCGYPAESLFKVASSRLRSLAPAAHRLLKSFQYSREEQIALITAVQWEGRSLEDAARSWIQSHEALWSAWLRPQRPDFWHTIPPPANAWAAEHLYVLEKDANGVFLDANARYVDSLKPLFPEIQSVTHLMGRDDFHFYPPELAEKFRADDERVRRGGEPLETVEINEPVGGVPTMVWVTKVPLRDETGAIIGLRAVWHEHPRLMARTIPEGVEISFPTDTGLFHLERREALDPASPWEPLALTPAEADGTLVVPAASSGPQTLFRLAANRPVKIGALLSLTGDWSSLGRNCEAVLQAGLEAVNLADLSSGSPLHFTYDVRDTRLSPDTAREQLERLAADGVQIVVGPQSSAELRVLKPVADARGVLLISPSSTASSLAFTGDNVFRFCPDDVHEAEALVALLQADGIQALVPIWRDDAGNQGLRDSTARLFPARGGVVTAGFRYPASETDFTAAVAELSAQVSAALEAHPGKVAVYLAGFDEVTGLFKQARTHAVLSSVPWYGSDGVVQSQALAGDPEAAQFAFERGFPCPIYGLDPRYQDTWGALATLVQTRSGIEVDAFTLAAYDGLQVAAQAYRAVAEGASLETLKAALTNAAGAYVGATGPTLLNAAGDRAGGAFDFWTLRPGANGHVWHRSISYQPEPGGPGVITRHP